MHCNKRVMLDGNGAVASVAYRMNEVIAIYPITPSSPMSESADAWATRGRQNVWGQTPSVVEMQSEAGVIGSVHGALQSGALTTTFTSSQGLLLMIPNLYKIAGELTSFCMHVAARAVATHALSIFGDHSDVMACRQTGCVLLASNSVQEAHDLACIGQVATLQARLPVIHFFDGFRTSHEINGLTLLNDEQLLAMLDPHTIARHRERALSPDTPRIRGTAQNPDVFFQAREASNRFYLACPDIVQNVMDRFAALTGRRYSLFEYAGHPEAEDVIVIIGSASETVEQTVRSLTADGRRVGVLKVRLYRPFDAARFVSVLPASVRRLAVMDRTKEPGAVGEPLYQDVIAALTEDLPDDRVMPRVIGGRYGLGSKEFTPAMVKAIYGELRRSRPRRHFTVGIMDDVTHLSLPIDDWFGLDTDGATQAIFYGLGADGTVGANKNAIKIIGEEAGLHAQGYFVYDSKKSGATTVSHLRFGPNPIHAPYLIRSADFVACHQFRFLDRLDILEHARFGGTLLLNAPYSADRVWERLPRELQQQIIEKNLRVFTIDAYAIASDIGLGRRINTIMQTCFFAIANVLPRNAAIRHIKKAIEKTYASKGGDIVKQNCAAVDQALAHLHQLDVPDTADSTHYRLPIVSEEAPDFVQRVTAVMLADKGDYLPVSAFPVDGTWPTGTSQWEKRSIATKLPQWDTALCIQCNKCAMVCPHAAIRAKVFEPSALADAPNTFQTMDYKAPDLRGLRYTLQVAPDDCTGCGLCVNICPAKDKAEPGHKAIDMVPRENVRGTDEVNWDYFKKLPDVTRTRIVRLDAKGSQFFQPLMQFSGACAGCGETPYIKLLTQLFGDRAMIANATGCSSIFGGNLPTTPYCVNNDGRGPAWANSLFENNAEFGFGMRMAVDQLAAAARILVHRLAGRIGDTLANDLIAIPASDEASLHTQRQRVHALRRKLAKIDAPEARRLDHLADFLVPRSVWLVGGDGWAYDIGYGGLDHVLAQSRNVNVLVLDTEVYSNTGGQQSKATPLGAAVKFAAAGKHTGKKDLGLMAMCYGHAYVASIAMGANDNHAVKTLIEAEQFPGPSLVIAYSHCMAHGYDMSKGLDHQKLAVETGMWPLYRFDPRRIEQGKPPLQLDSKAPHHDVRDYMNHQTRFRMVEQVDAEEFKALAEAAQTLASRRLSLYQQLAAITLSDGIGN
ncbi:pyruvate:ferredoxin (flavodoxin) oxidoreductase [Phycisphaerales bacterium AB-hyl4]|uniref:Pyruvate:ferredoxin (Flavodoxin) oxidoreductase n=1 Tax=Natronomicrosphaera hydrolytica TaxID=3242702 RepID=A0ABV4UAE1_9BACT